jgi:hypothetical protein
LNFSLISFSDAKTQQSYDKNDAVMHFVDSFAALSFTKRPHIEGRRNESHDESSKEIIN